MDLKEILAKTLESVRKSCEIFSANWQKNHQIHYKGSIDLVTETDLEIQKFLQEELRQILPEAEFVGEEGCDLATVAERLSQTLAWVVDPVDGTTNFVHQIPFSCISVALCQNGKPVLGVIQAPLLNETFYAYQNGGAFLNRSPIKVSSTGTLQRSLIATGLPYDIDAHLTNILIQLNNLLPKTQGLRRLGSAELDLAYVACGRFDGFYETGLKPWDVAAGWIITEEAGGKVSMFNGEPYQFMKPVLVSNGQIHSLLSNLLV